MRIRRILFAFVLAAYVCAAPAKAGAFLAPAGEGEIITSVGFSDSTRAFDNNGRLVPIPAYRKFTLGTYIEYGLTDRLTLVAQPEADVVHQNQAGAPAPAAASTDIGARIGLLTFGASVVSLQCLTHFPFGPSSQQIAYFDEARVTSVDARLLFGHSFAIGSWPGFFDVEASHSWQSDGLPEEWHADLTLGLRPRPKLLVMLASSMTMAGPSPGACATWTECWRWLKLQPSIVYDIFPHWSAEVGVFMTVAGANAGREIGPSAALWYHF